MPGVVRRRRPQERRTPCHIEQVVMTNQRVWLRLQKLGTTHGDDSPAIHQGAGTPQRRCLGTCGRGLQTAQSGLEGALPFEDLGELSSQRSQSGVGSGGPSLGRDRSWKGCTPPSTTANPPTQPAPSCYFFPTIPPPRFFPSPCRRILFAQPCIFSVCFCSWLSDCVISGN